MQTLILSNEAFIKLLPSLISSGVLFEAKEDNGEITVKFTGGY